MVIPALMCAPCPYGSGSGPVSSGSSHFVEVRPPRLTFPVFFMPLGTSWLMLL
jgi:hypothetical protein